MTLIVLPCEPTTQTALVDFDLPCHRVDPELFFAENPAVIEAAKQLCLTCPLRTACLAGALERQEPHGVWGGELFEAGVVIARKRPRGRPRKTPAAPAAVVTELPPSPFRGGCEDWASAG